MTQILNAASSSIVDESRLVEIVTVVEQICLGNFEARIKNLPELSGLERKLCLRINEMIDRSDAYIRETSACLSYMADNQYFRRIAPEGLPGSFEVATQNINVAADGIEAKINKFSAAVDAISTAAVQLNSNAQVMGDTVKLATEKTQTVAVAAEETGANTQTVASAAEELNASIQEINRQVSTSANMSSGAVEQSREINKLVAGLSDASVKIGDVVSLINNIAGQTKLLALNATIEAARAGEAGRGFTVVASEVKNLSSQTEKATNEIQSHVNEIQSAASNTAKSISDISVFIDQINEVSSAIASAVEEQGAATQEISRNVQEAATGVDDVTVNISAVNETVSKVNEQSLEVMAIANELENQAELLASALNSK
ncbi:MAG: methyl-accepting chemotaxis protein [Pseudomonas marincola]